MKLSPLLACLALAPLAQAQLLGEAPPPSALERELAAVESVEELERMLASAQGREQRERRVAILGRLVALRPHVGRLRYELAAAHAEAGDKRNAYDALVRLTGQGYAFEIERDERFRAVHGTQVWDYVVGHFQANRKPFGTGEVAYRVTDGGRLFEAIAWDPTRERLLLGALRDGSIVFLGEDGRPESFLAEPERAGLWSVSALAVDAANGKLWAASTALPVFARGRPEHAGISGVFRFDLEGGRFERRFLLPPQAGAAITALAVGARGEIYAADGPNGTVYLIDGAGMRPYVGAREWRDLRGLAVSGDGRRLYVADYDAGVWAVDLVAGRADALKVPSHLSLDGIESLAWWKGHLVLVQSGTAPAMRVMRLALDEQGAAVTQVQPLEANHPALVRPGSAALAGDRLFVIANSRRADAGEPAPRIEEGETRVILRSDLTGRSLLPVAPQPLRRR